MGQRGPKPGTRYISKPGPKPGSKRKRPPVASDRYDSLSNILRHSWLKLAHDFVDDAKIWHLTDEFSNAALRPILKVYSILYLQKNDPIPFMELVHKIAPYFREKSAKMRVDKQKQLKTIRLLNKMKDLDILTGAAATLEPPLKLSKYANYNGGKQYRRGESSPSEKKGGEKREETEKRRTENPTLEAAGSPSARNGDGKGGSGRTEGERRSGNNRRKIWRPEDWTPDPDSPGAALLGLRGEEWEREADRIVRDLVARGWTPEEIRRSVDWYWPFDEDFTSERGS